MQRRLVALGQDVVTTSRGKRSCEVHLQPVVVGEKRGEVPSSLHGLIDGTQQVLPRLDFTLGLRAVLEEVGELVLELDPLRRVERPVRVAANEAVDQLDTFLEGRPGVGFPTDAPKVVGKQLEGVGEALSVIEGLGRPLDDLASRCDGRLALRKGFLELAELGVCGRPVPVNEDAETIEIRRSRLQLLRRGVERRELVERLEQVLLVLAVEPCHDNAILRDIQAGQRVCLAVLAVDQALKQAGRAAGDLLACLFRRIFRQAASQPDQTLAQLVGNLGVVWCLGALDLQPREGLLVPTPGSRVAPVLSVEIPEIEKDTTLAEPVVKHVGVRLRDLSVELQGLGEMLLGCAERPDVRADHTQERLSPRRLELDRRVVG